MATAKLLSPQFPSAHHLTRPRLLFPTQIPVPGHLHKAHHYRCSSNSGLTSHCGLVFSASALFCAKSSPLSVRKDPLPNWLQLEFYFDIRSIFDYRTVNDFSRSTCLPKSISIKAARLRATISSKVTLHKAATNKVATHNILSRSEFPSLRFILAASLCHRTNNFLLGLRCASTTTRRILPTTSPDAISRTTAA